MKRSFYTIDDLRLGHDHRGITGWRMSRFLCLEDALEHYESLPESGAKVLGIEKAGQPLALVQRLSVSSGDTAGKDVLLLDFLEQPDWRGSAELTDHAGHCVHKLGVHCCLWNNWLFFVPEERELRPELLDKYLWGSADEPGRCIQRVEVDGVGWMRFDQFQKSCPTDSSQVDQFPLVLRFRVDGMTAIGDHAPLEITPWEYMRLEHRTKDRIRQIKLRRNAT